MGKAKGTQPSKKTEQKIKEKIIQDKTFGLKNKNKSIKVQKYIKSVENQVMQKKGSEQARLNAQFQEKAEKKKSLAVNALLASVYKDLGKKKGDDKKHESDSEEEETQESVAVVRDKIDYYNDPRVVRKSSTKSLGGDIPLHSLSKITCKYFLQAIEKSQYGFRWGCPNKGDNCPYRHFLPEGYILKKDMKILEEIMKAEAKEDLSLEERIEQQRAELPSEGLTPVTKETFMAWKVKKQKEKEKLEKIAAMDKKGGSKILSGKALFKFDPSLFIDDDDATEEYEEEERKEGESDEEEEKKEDFPEIENEKQTLKENGEKEEDQAKEANGEEIEIDEALFEQNLEDVELG